MKISNILSLLSIVTFIGYMLFYADGSKIGRSYILYTLCIFPFLNLFATPVEQGRFTVFDINTYVAIVFLVLRGKVIEGIPRTHTYIYYFAAFTILLLVGSLQSEFVGVSIINLVKIGAVFIYCTFLLNECFKDPHFILVIIRILKFTCVFSLVFLALQLIIGLELRINDLSPNTTEYDANIRYPSFFFDPQIYGQFLAMSSFLFLIGSKNQKGIYTKIGAFILVLAAIFLTGTRAAFLGLCVGLFMVVLLGEKRHKVAGIISLVIGCILILTFSGNLALFNREVGIDSMANARLFYWKGAYEIFLENPIWGIGIGTYQDYVSIYSQDQYWVFPSGIEYTNHPESGYLKILSEIGIVGFIVSLFFIVIPIVKAAPYFIYARKSTLLLFLAASLLSWMISFVTLYSFQDMRIFIQVATLLCLLVAGTWTMESKLANSFKEISPPMN